MAMLNSTKNYDKIQLLALSQDICDQIDQKLLTLEGYIEDRSWRRSE